jgi:peptide deformylase
MAILKVARMGHPVLRKRAAPVPVAEITKPPFQRLIADMFDTMREYAGIGLAGPQVHEGLRVFVAGVREAAGPLGTLSDDGEMPLVALINPEVTLVGEAPASAWEGCLSIPDIRGIVPRAPEVRVEAYDRHGKRVAFSATGLPARVIQHEADHLDGILFFDRMSSLDSLAFMDEYRRFWTEDDAE